MLAVKVIHNFTTAPAPSGTAGTVGARSLRKGTMSRARAGFCVSCGLSGSPRGNLISLLRLTPFFFATQSSKSNCPDRTTMLLIRRVGRIRYRTVLVVNPSHDTKSRSRTPLTAGRIIDRDANAKMSTF